MILVDTSIWVDHLRQGDAGLSGLLDQDKVCCHPFILGELALGNLRQRDMLLGLMRSLPQASVAEDAEVLRFIDDNGLAGTGIGYVDAHLLAAARLSGGRLWTRDRRLGEAAARLALV